MSAEGTKIRPDHGRRLGPWVYDVVKERVLDGTWRAGQAIAVEQLKSDFGVSKQPIMEALRRLDSEGLVEIIPQVGCRMPTYSAEETSDFFRIFASLESEATAIAAGRSTQPAIARLVSINNAIRAQQAVGNSAERVRHYRMLNREFHTVVLEMARSEVVISSSRRMWDISDLLISASGRTDHIAQDIQHRHVEHDLIIDALREGDADAARAHMRGHILRNIPMLELIEGP